MLSEKMESAINEQINKELYSGYLYLAMAAYLESENLPGFAIWMEQQAKEELSHAMKFYAFVNERNGSVVLGAIDKPPAEWDSVLAVFEHAYGHEKKVTGMIHNLVNMAIEESDHATRSFLDWYVDEQVEEESSVNDVVQKLTMIGDSTNGLFMLDRAMAQRGAK